MHRIFLDMNSIPTHTSRLMDKREFRWLNGFDFGYNPSKSFLKNMNNALRKEYTEITGNDFDVLFMNIVDPDDLIYLPAELTATLKARIEVQKPTYWGNCLIGWRSKNQDRLIKPEDDVTEDEIEFKWLELSLPVFPEESQKKPDVAKRLGLSLTYTLVVESGIESQDLEFYVQLKDSTIVERLAERFGFLQEQWNQQADQDISRTKGYLHQFYFDREEDGEYVFRIDMGSAGVEGLKLALNEFNDPAWRIQRVEIFNS
ncbi:hypothetical protein [Larkinella rosea]|uniref:Uncharacterized protein n=1 Tax=Larkinella rosea TaxID=2025312 RepID=A0A3P1BP41_9BACT|nr:hypothetical protein [Larkinella rosea]RRB02805.1 hypothetical protein EHT25_20410 [Larkinella rosea]